MSEESIKKCSDSHLINVLNIITEMSLNFMK